jgi:hypothetical protein
MIIAEIMHQENNKLAEVLRIFRYACMNLKNKEYHLGTKSELQQINYIKKQYRMFLWSLCIWKQ